MSCDGAKLALSGWPGQGPVRGRGSRPCLACLPADSPGTVSWQPAKLPPLPAGWHPGPDARGPAGGQQFERCRAVISARRLQAGACWGLQPPPVALGSQAQLRRLSAPPPKSAPPQSWEEQICRSHSKKSRAGAVGPPNSTEPPEASISSSGNGAERPPWPASQRRRSASARWAPACPGPVPGAKDAASS